MKRLTLDQKFRLVKSVAGDSYIGIHNFGMLHEVADALNMKNNTGANLHSINYRVCKVLRDLIKAGYPIKEYRIKCYSWTAKETWHACFKIEESEVNNNV